MNRFTWLTISVLSFAPISGHAQNFDLFKECSLTRMKQESFDGRKRLSRVDLSGANLNEFISEIGAKPGDFDVQVKYKNSTIQIFYVEPSQTDKLYPRKASVRGRTISWSAKYRTRDPELGVIFLKLVGKYDIDRKHLTAIGSGKGSGRNANYRMVNESQYQCN